MLVGALAEVLSLGAIVPFLAILADPVQALQRPLVAQVSAIRGPDTFGGKPCGAKARRLVLAPALASWRR